MSGFLGPSSGGVGAGGIEIFRWNRVNTSQFAAAAAYADGSGAGSLAVITSAWGAPALRFTSSAGTSANLSWLALDPIVFPTSRRDLIIEIETVDWPGSGFTGVVALAEGSGAGYHALNHYFAGPEWASRITAATRLNPGVTGSGTGLAGASRVVYNIRGIKQVGSPPWITSWTSLWNAVNAGIPSPRRSGITANIGGMRDFGDGSAYAASWNALSLDRWGLSLQSSGGNPLGTNWDIADIRVYLLPGS